MQWLGGVPCMVPNRTDDIDTGSPHWHVSYNNRDIADYGCDTTALVIGHECFLVLNGDHREGLKAAVELAKVDFAVSTLNRCLEYVRNNRELLNDKSDALF
jgi:hypothetical protein